MAAESTATRARARAEARRARILAQSEDRINVVSGLTPRSQTAKDEAAAAGTTIEKVGDEGIDVEQKYDEFSSIVEDNTNNNADDDDVAAVDVDAVVVSNVSDPPAVQVVGDADEARGARRMAAMRRRRVKGGGGGSSKSEMAGEEKITTDDAIVESGEISTAGTMEVPVLVVEAEESSPTVVKTTNRVSEGVVTLETTAKHMDIDDEDVEQKKYMGVARMRRKRLKEEKEKRLQEIANDGDSPRSTVELIATLGVTATTMRKGAVATVDVNGIVGVNGGSSKKTKKSWITFLIPPMKLMPRLVTLLLLFIAGFDLGTQPHRPTPSSLTSLYPQHSIDDLRVLFGGSHLIHRIETSLTKPWEYGMGGRVAYMTGKAASAPPTAMPSYFDNKVAEMEEECIDNGVVGECTVSPIDGVNGGSATKEKKNRLQTLLDKKRNNKNNNKKVKIKDRLQELAKGDNSIDVGGAVNDDEFNNPDRTTKPMGVLDITNIAIDPIFRVDLDSLLYNANLPVPIEYAAKVAISFHRLWVYYLWTMPTTVLKSMVGMPRRVLSGWIANPPYMLCVALVIRFVTRVVVGNGKSPFSLDSSKDDGGWAGGGGNNSSGGGASSLGKNNLDLLTKGMEFVKNYASSKFPMTSLVVGTLSKVMKVDMYVLLCGLLIGLAITPIDEDDDYLLSTWDDVGGGSVENVVRRSVLGDGEL